MSISAPTEFLIGKVSTTYNQIIKELGVNYLSFSTFGNGLSISLCFRDMTDELDSVNKYADKVITYFGLNKSDFSISVSRRSYAEIEILIVNNDKSLEIKLDNRK